MASDDDVHSLILQKQNAKTRNYILGVYPDLQITASCCLRAPRHYRHTHAAAPDPDPPLFYEHKSLGVPEVRETAMNNMSVPHSVIHSSNFTNPDEIEDGERKKDSGDAPKPKVSEGKVGHKRKGLMK